MENKQRTDISTIGEFGLIHRLTENISPRNTSTLKGVGDDAAVLDYDNKRVLVTTDLLLEGITPETSGLQIGRRQFLRYIRHERSPPTDYRIIGYLQTFLHRRFGRTLFGYPFSLRHLRSRSRRRRHIGLDDGARHKHHLHR